MIELIRFIAIQKKVGDRFSKVPHTSWAAQNLFTATMLTSVPTGSMSSRIEANALTALCFRNSPLENIHAGEVLDDDAMRNLMIFSTRALNSALALKKICYDLGQDGIWFWERLMLGYAQYSCRLWEVGNDIPESEDDLDLDIDDGE